MSPIPLFGNNIACPLFLFMQVLELGCGNSQMCEELYKDGVTDITCIDLSSVAVEKMQKRLFYRGLKGWFAIGPGHCLESYMDMGFYQKPFFYLGIEILMD